MRNVNCGYYDSMIEPTGCSSSTWKERGAEYDQIIYFIFNLFNIKFHGDELHVSLFIETNH